MKKVFRSNNSVQEWLPIEKIFDNGVVKTKNDKYIKIIKVLPINYNLKSNLEKEAILNSYKIFLKTCNFDLQILVQSKKENLSKHISSVKKFAQNDSKTIQQISDEYINYINNLNINKKSAVKNFFIIIKKEKNNLEKTTLNDMESIVFEELNDDFLRIKETLSRCGNIVLDINNREQCKEILFSFFYPKKSLS